MTDQSGAVVHGYRHDAWGTIETGATQAGYAYTAREWDPEINLYYYRARYYDPKVGRFVSEDPGNGRAATSATHQRGLPTHGAGHHRHACLDPPGMRRYCLN
jgi:RHS repeat-associated protein